MRSESDAQDVLVLTRSWPFGLFRVDESGDNLLFRPYRRIALTGAPTGTLNYALLVTDEKLPTSGIRGFWRERLLDWIAPSRWRFVGHRKVLRLFGSFCYTPGRMILFFPGFRGTYFSDFDDQGRHALRRDQFRIDHFSLEPRFTRWHVTSASDDHIRGFRTEFVEGNLLFWFGVSVQGAPMKDQTELEPICRVTTWSFSAPSTDSRRRFNDAFNAARESTPHVLEAPDNRVDSGPWFWHFVVLVQTTMNDNKQSSLPFPLPQAPFADIRSDIRRLAVRSHPFRLPGFSGIVYILVARLSGSLPEPVLLMRK